MQSSESEFQPVLGRGHRHKNTARFNASISAELAPEDSQEVVPAASKPRRIKKSKVSHPAQNRFDGLPVEGDVENKDSDYAYPLSTQSDPPDSDHESDVVDITNEEVCCSLLDG
jgi:hypothetical protein